MLVHSLIYFFAVASFLFLLSFSSSKSFIQFLILISYVLMGKSLFARIFSNFDLKFGREVDLDELNNVIKCTFSKSPLPTELFILENRAKICIFWVWQLITFNLWADWNKIFNSSAPNISLSIYKILCESVQIQKKICSNHQKVGSQKLQFYNQFLILISYVLISKLLLVCWE